MVCQSVFLNAKFCSPPAIFYQLFKIEWKIFSFNDRFCFFTEICKNRGANDQPDVFEQGEIKQHEDKPQDNARESEEETQPAILKFRYPTTQSRWE